MHRCHAQPHTCSMNLTREASVLHAHLRQYLCPKPGQVRKQIIPASCASHAHGIAPSIATRRALVRVYATNTATSSVTAEQWWKKDADLWTEVHDLDSFKREVLNSPKPVVVDWFASWCTGCQRSYPEICKVLRNSPELTSSYKFVKVCVDEMKAFSREQGVTALPRLSLYRPGQGRVLTWDMPLSRVKHLKKNLLTALAHPGSALALDPNNFIVPTGPPPSPEEAKKAEAAKAEAIAALNKGSTSLFDRLRAVANGNKSPASNGAPAAPPVPASPTRGAPAAPSTQGSPATAAANGTAYGSSGASPEKVVQAAAEQTAAAQAVTAPAGAAGAPVSSADVPSNAEQYLAAFKAQFGHTWALERQMFLNRVGSEYGYGGQIEDLYAREVGTRMPPLGPSKRTQHYLDYTGSGVYCNSQVEAAFNELRSTMFGNPHAQNPSSQLSGERIDEVREQILRFFNADPAEWQVAFTRSATGALQLVGETFPWSSKSLFRYLRENHNSVLGIREYTLSHDGQFQSVDENLVTDWLRAPPPPYEDDFEDMPSKHDHVPGDCSGVNASGECEVSFDDEPPKEEEVTYSLFAYPAEENFAGVKYPLSWAADIKRRSTATHKWMVMIDAAAFTPTQPLDLSQVSADFVDIAFYKMFGYPTGLGALLVRTEAVPLLKKVFWGGGSVALVSSKDNFHTLKCRPSDMLEDGTVAFLDIISLKHGFAVMDKLGGIASIQAHVACLTEWLFEALTKLRHSNGKPLVRVFGKHARMDHRKVQGGIVNFQLRAPDGLPISYREFERDAAAAGFHVRTGAECNPGACYAYLGITDEEIETLAGEKEGCDDEVEYVSVQRPASQRGAEVHSADSLRTLSQAQRLELGLPQPDANSKWVQAPLGSIRASLGWLSTFEDVYALAEFVARYKDRQFVTADSE